MCLTNSIDIPRYITDWFPTLMTFVYVNTVAETAEPPSNEATLGGVKGKEECPYVGT